MVEESGQTAELDSDHGNIDERFGAGDRLFVVSDQSTMMQQPAEGTLDHPTIRQHFKPAHVVRK